MAKGYNPYQEMLEVLDQAAKKLGLEEKDYVQLKYPEREVKVAIPVEMDDGSIQVLKVTGYSIPVSPL